jgi:hypothetical protein
MLMARHAQLKTNAKMRYSDASDGWEYIGWWTNKSDEIRWELAVLQTGTYGVTAQVACIRELAGSTVEVLVDNQRLSFVIPDSGGWVEFSDVDVGKVRLQTGTHNVVVRAVNVKKEFVCFLQAIVISSQP